ncbi:hypothetical protein [Streptomyces sp. CB01201]|uniref:hypothetical protein n=1 Tax=Streptomyces sp. CB01201 TaxID=2020324 RepID=UPI001F362AB0|nr:hypothetical protein [Streptomyces sp. CB01201]
MENWFTAVWNYNLGFNPPSDAANHGGNWGLGWYNNPANPIYQKGWGHPFMNTDADGANANRDAAHPQDWPYEVKVMGWAAWSIDTGYSYSTSGRQDWPGETGFSSAGFRPAWWDTNSSRTLVLPALGVFCNSANNCNPDIPPNCTDEACYAQYWWHQPNATWKGDCATQCGHESLKYQTLVSEPGRGYRLQTGTPVCSGAPTGSQVVTSIPSGTPTWGDGRRAVVAIAARGLSVVSAAAFAADHTMGGGVNVAHAGVLAVMATAVVLWQRFLWPALIVHALYDACVFAGG